MKLIPSRPVEPDPRSAVVVEVIGLLLLVAGAVGLVVTAFRHDELLGWAAASTTALVLGVALTVRDT